MVVKLVVLLAVMLDEKKGGKLVLLLVCHWAVRKVVKKVEKMVGMWVVKLVD